MITFHQSVSTNTTTFYDSATSKHYYKPTFCLLRMLNAKQSSNPHTWLYIHRLCSDRSWLVISLAMLLLSTGLQPAAFQFLSMKSTIGTRLILCRLCSRRVTTAFSESAVCFQLLLSKCSEIRKIQLLTTLQWVR